MKCLTVKQPWATLLATGETRYIVRAWRTFYRGPLLIHASAELPRAGALLCADDVMRAYLHRHGIDYAFELPRRAVVGTISVLDCFYLNTDADLARLDPADPAVVFGQARPGQWVWSCADARPLARPVPLAGRLGIFAVPEGMLG